MKRLLLALVFCLMPAMAWPQGIPAPVSFLSAVSTNCTLVERGNVQYMGGLYVNTTAAIYYIKLYDTNVTPTAGLIPVRRIPIPFVAASAGGVVADFPPGGLNFNNGFGFCLTGAIADNDATNAAAGVTINFSLH